MYKYTKELNKASVVLGTSAARQHRALPTTHDGATTQMSHDETLITPHQRRINAIWSTNDHLRKNIKTFRGVLISAKTKRLREISLWWAEQRRSALTGVEVIEEESKWLRPRGIQHGSHKRFRPYHVTLYCHWATTPPSGSTAQRTETESYSQYETEVVIER